MQGVIKLDGLSFGKGDEINEKHLEILQNWKKVSILLSNTIDQLRTARTNAIKDKNRHKSLLIKYKNNYEYCKKQLDTTLLTNKKLKALANKGTHYQQFCDEFSSIVLSMKKNLDQVKETQQKLEYLDQKLTDAEKEYKNINHQDIKNHHNLAQSQKKASYILSLIQEIDELKANNEKLLLNYHNSKEKLMNFNSDTDNSMQIVFEQINEFELMNKSDTVPINPATLSKDLNELINESINDYANSDADTEYDESTQLFTDDIELLNSTFLNNKIHLEQNPSDQDSNQSDQDSNQSDQDSNQSDQDSNQSDQDYYNSELTLELISKQNNPTVASILSQKSF